MLSVLVMLPMYSKICPPLFENKKITNKKFNFFLKINQFLNGNDKAGYTKDFILVKIAHRMIADEIGRL
jgi:hypothetical protein